MSTDGTHRLAAGWAQLAGSDDPQVVAGLAAVLRKLAAVVLADPFLPSAAREIGVDLLDTDLLGPPRGVENLLGPTLRLLRADAPDALGLDTARDRHRLDTAVDEIVTGLISGLERRSGTPPAEPHLLSRSITDAGLRAAYEQSAIGCGIADPHGVLVDINPALRRLLGIGAAPGRPITDFVHPDDVAGLLEGLRQPLHEEGAAVRIELRMVRRGGDGFWADLIASRVLDDEGKPSFLQLLIDDRARPRLVREPGRQRS